MTLLSWGQNLARLLIAPMNRDTASLSVGVGMAIIALTVTGLGWKPSVLVTWLMKMALRTSNFILLT